MKLTPGTQDNQMSNSDLLEAATPQPLQKDFTKRDELIALVRRWHQAGSCPQAFMRDVGQALSQYAPIVWLEALEFMLYREYDLDRYVARQLPSNATNIKINHDGLVSYSLV